VAQSRPEEAIRDVEFPAADNPVLSRARPLPFPMPSKDVWSGIARGIAGNASKHLSLAAAPIVLTANGTCSGGPHGSTAIGKHDFLTPETQSIVTRLYVRGRRLSGRPRLWFLLAASQTYGLNWRELVGV